MRYAELIESLHIFAKCSSEGLGTRLFGAEHDAVYAIGAEYSDEALQEIDMDAYLEEHGSYPVVDDSRLSAEDNARLRSLDWFVDFESQAWMHYV